MDRNKESEALAKALGIDAESARGIFRAFEDVAKQRLQETGRFGLQGFGTFTFVKTRSQKPDNESSGNAKGLVFRKSRELRQAITGATPASQEGIGDSIKKRNQRRREREKARRMAAPPPPPADSLFSLEPEYGNPAEVFKARICAELHGTGSPVASNPGADGACSGVKQPQQHQNQEMIDLVRSLRKPPADPLPIPGSEDEKIRRLARTIASIEITESEVEELKVAGRTIENLFKCLEFMARTPEFHMTPTSPFDSYTRWTKLRWEVKRQCSLPYEERKLLWGK